MTGGPPRRASRGPTDPIASPFVRLRSPLAHKDASHHLASGPPWNRARFFQSR